MKQIFPKKYRTAPVTCLVLASFPAYGATPAAPAPAPGVPSDNAYDYYIRAGQLHALLQKEHPEASAVDQVTDHRDRRGPSAQQLKMGYPLAAKEAWIKTNAPVLKLLRQGFPYSYKAPALGINQAFPFLQQARQLARLLLIESHCYSERGNWRGAADSTLDILHLGRDLPRGGLLIGALVGYAVDAIGRGGLWKVAPHLNAAESLHASLGLQQLAAGRMPFADTLREEKAYALAEIKKMMSDPNWRKSLEKDSETKPEDTKPEDKKREDTIPENSPPTRFYSRPEILRNFTGYMDALIAQQRVPYALRKTPPLPGDPVTRMYAVSRADWNVARDEAGNLLLQVALAVRAFKLSGGEFPISLQNLVPSYLRAVPADPFGKGEPLHYRRTPQGYVLYSVGPDGKDDGGAPVHDPARTGRGAYYIGPDSKGDIVAGINR